MKKSESKKTQCGDSAPVTPGVPRPGVAEIKPGKVATAAQATTAPETQPGAQDDPQSATRPETNSSVLEEIGTQIIAAHAAAKGAFMDVLFSATKCGLLLIAAKTVLKVGTFESWFERRKFDFTKVTRCKYMRLAERLCEEAGSKPGLLLSIQTGTGGLPVSFTFDEPRLRTTINSVSDERSLSELYFDWDVVKRPETTSNGKQVSRHNACKDESPEEVVGSWNQIVKGLPIIFPRLQPEMQTSLVAALEGLLAKLKNIQGSEPQLQRQQQRNIE